MGETAKWRFVPKKDNDKGIGYYVPCYQDPYVYFSTQFWLGNSNDGHKKVQADITDVYSSQYNASLDIAKQPVIKFNKNIQYDAIYNSFVNYIKAAKKAESEAIQKIFNIIDQTNIPEEIKGKLTNGANDFYEAYNDGRVDIKTILDVINNLLQNPQTFADEIEKANQKNAKQIHERQADYFRKGTPPAFITRNQEVYDEIQKKINGLFDDTINYITAHPNSEITQALVSAFETGKTEEVRLKVAKSAEYLEKIMKIIEGFVYNHVEELYDQIQKNVYQTIKRKNGESYDTYVISSDKEQLDKFLKDIDDYINSLKSKQKKLFEVIEVEITNKTPFQGRKGNFAESQSVIDSTAIIDLLAGKQNAATDALHVYFAASLTHKEIDNGIESLEDSIRNYLLQNVKFANDNGESLKKLYSEVNKNLSETGKAIDSLVVVNSSIKTYFDNAQIDAKSAPTTEGGRETTMAKFATQVQNGINSIIGKDNFSIENIDNYSSALQFLAINQNFTRAGRNFRFSEELLNSIFSSEIMTMLAPMLLFDMSQITLDMLYNNSSSATVLNVYKSNSIYIPLSVLLTQALQQIMGMEDKSEQYLEMGIVLNGKHSTENYSKNKFGDPTQENWDKTRKNYSNNIKPRIVINNKVHNLYATIPSKIG